MLSTDDTPDMVQMAGRGPQHGNAHLVVLACLLRYISRTWAASIAHLAPMFEPIPRPSPRTRMMSISSYDPTCPGCEGLGSQTFPECANASPCLGGQKLCHVFLLVASSSCLTSTSLGGSRSRIRGGTYFWCRGQDVMERSQAWAVELLRPASCCWASSEVAGDDS